MAHGLNKTSEIDLESSQSSFPCTWPPHFLNFLQAPHLPCSLLTTPLSFKPQLQGASFTPSTLSFPSEIGGGSWQWGVLTIAAIRPFAPAEVHCPSSCIYPLCMCLPSRLCLSPGPFPLMFASADSPGQKRVVG